MLSAILIWVIKFIVIPFIIATVLIAMTPSISKAQTQHAGYVFMANSDTTFGWYTPFWTKYIDTAVFVMTFTRAQRSIDSIGTLIGTKKSISDSGRAISNYITGYSLNKVRDSITALINAVRSDTIFTPTLNTGVRLSTTKNYILNLYVTIGIASALVGNNQGNVTLQRSPDNVTWTNVAISNNAMLGVLSTSSQTVSLTALLPAGYYYKLVTASVGANTASFVGVTSNAAIF